MASFGACHRPDTIRDGINGKLPAVGDLILDPASIDNPIRKTEISAEKSSFLEKSRSRSSRTSAQAGRDALTPHRTRPTAVSSGSLAHKVINGTRLGYPTGPGRGRTWCASLRDEWPLAVFCFCIAAIALLYNLFGNPDVLYDEAAYTWTAKQVVLQGNLALTNQPLFVHPPLMFLLEAAWLKLTGMPPRHCPPRSTRPACPPPPLVSLTYS